jgi:autotransporter-associated beta strand protein
VVNPQTVNAPLVLEGDYTFGSGGSSSSATLSFSGGITPAATDGVTTLTLDGTNTGADTISGVLADNGAGRLAVTKSGSGVWTLSGANTYSGGTIVLGGTLRFNITSGSPTITAGATATVASGATLELAGSVSALGTAGGNRVHLTNNSIAPGVVVSGTNQVVRAIDGSGNVQVTAGSDLTADHIIQNALIIGGTLGSPGLVMIDASDASGNPLASLAVPLASASIMPLGAGGNLAYPIGYATNSDPLADWPPLIVSVAAAPAAVPEPSSLFMLAIGGLMVAHAALRRSRTLNWKNRSLPATIHQG